MSHIAGRLTREELQAQIASGSIDTVILAITDMQGRLQGKRLDANFFVDMIGNGVVEDCGSPSWPRTWTWRPWMASPSRHGTAVTATSGFDPTSRRFGWCRGTKDGDPLR